MKKLIVASNNRGKIKEIKELLCQFEVRSLSEEGISLSVEESGKTFEENALLKARALRAITGGPVIADDSGLCCRALSGEPGVMSARYAGEECDTEKNNAKLLNELSGVTDRSAKFVCAIAFISEDGEEIVVSGECPGRILTEADGENGFGYDCLFFSDELGESFGRCNSVKKNKVSHRARALEQLCKYFYKN